MSKREVKWDDQLETISVSFFDGHSHSLSFERWEEIYFRVKQCQEDNTAPGTPFDIRQEALLRPEYERTHKKEDVDVT